MIELTEEYLLDLIARGQRKKESGRPYLTCNGPLITPLQLQVMARAIRRDIEQDSGVIDDYRGAIKALFDRGEWSEAATVDSDGNRIPLDVYTADAEQLIVSLLWFERRSRGCGFILDPYIEDFVATNGIKPGEDFEITCPACGRVQWKRL